MSKKYIFIVLLSISFIAIAFYDDNYKRYYKVMMVQNDAPNFNKIKDIKLLKQTFIDYLLPKINQHNNTILKLRTKIINQNLNNKELIELAKKYNTTKDKLLEHIDIIPPSLAIAQAAIESSWGRSRFAKYNNYFGIWCFKKGCGIIPKNRDKNANHEVAIFITISDAISYYMFNLNKHNSYKKLRDVRSKLRNNNLAIDGEKLAGGLEKYSGVGHNYIKSIKNLIKYNKLNKYD